MLWNRAYAGIHIDGKKTTLTVLAAAPDPQTLAVRLPIEAPDPTQPMREVSLLSGCE